jgi:hypothetical protein
MSQGLGPSFDRAQARHDAAEPPSDHDCATEGHQWRTVRLAARTDKHGNYVCFVDRVCDECGKRKTVEI